MGSRAQFQQLETEIRAMRNRQAARLAVEYRPYRARLITAYNDVLDEMRPLYQQVARGSMTPEQFERRVTSLLNTLQADVQSMAASLEALGINAGLALGQQALKRGGLAVRFGRPLVEAVQAAANLVESEAWLAALGGSGAYHAGAVQEIVLRMIAEGHNPLNIARTLRNYFEVQKLPLIDLDRLMRTTQIYASRIGTQEIYKRNGVKEWIWSASLDDRVCMMCVSQHGTRHPVDELLNDHHNGRCAMIPVTPTWAELGFSDGVEPFYETGLNWLNTQPMEVQRRILGRSLYEAWQQGLTLSPELLTDVYTNPVFGEMRRPATLRTILERSGLVRN